MGEEDLREAARRAMGRSQPCSHAGRRRGSGSIHLVGGVGGEEGGATTGDNGGGEGSEVSCLVHQVYDGVVVDPPPAGQAEEQGEENSNLVGGGGGGPWRRKGRGRWPPW